MKNLVVPGLLTLCLLGCTAEVSEPATPPEKPAAETSHVVSSPEVHDAICGHVLPDVGRCGNYVKIDGEYVVLEWPELGRMEYCGEGEKGAKVEITGEMKAGKFVAKTYKRVE